MKRLLICSRSHQPHGGADRIIADLCRQLPQRGWQVTLGLTQGHRYNDVGHYTEVMGRDLPVRVLDGRLGTRSSRLRALRRMIRDERPDVVLSMRVFDAYEAVAMEKQSSGAGPRLAVGVRSFEAPYLVDLRQYREQVDLCVTSGELIARLATRYAEVAPERVVSIGGGVHAPEVTREERPPGSPIRLLYAGRLDNEQKRVLDLVPFVAELDRLEVPFCLHIAGNGPAEDDLRLQLARWIESGSVVFHGWLSRQELYTRLYPRSDCFVHFAAWEGMTIAPREAMAHGVVPVISQFHGQQIERQFIDGATALTFPVGQGQVAAACVARLAADKGLLARLSASAGQSQTGSYSFEGSMDAWAAALDACLLRAPMRGAIPDIAVRRSGRLQRLGVPGRLQDTLRDLLGWREDHRSPGSEWPTHSGMSGESERRRLAELADAVEAEFGVERAHAN